MITKFYLTGNKKQQMLLISRLSELVKNSIVFTNQHTVLLVLDTTEKQDDIIRIDSKIKSLYLKAYCDVIWWDENEYKLLTD